ncbi:MAG: formamidase [Clostridia bacterium]|nr:formamidase [Clostridia bacterium]
MKHHKIKATTESVHWGYYNNRMDPIHRIRPGDIVDIETITHHAGDAPDYMMDDEIRKIYDAININDRGPGCHILTGPIYIEGVGPGDILECRILDLQTRPNIPYGINFKANWGLLYDDFDQKEYVTLYEIDEEIAAAKAVFNYEFPGVLDKPGPYTAPDAVERKPALEGIRVPLNYHLGTIGVAPAKKGVIDTIPPGVFGGNMDSKDYTVGSSMYYPVQVEGALFSVGDPHLAQGDGEVAGTAIEGHMNATLQFFVRDDIKIQNPVLETPTHWVIHGFHQDLNKAMRLATLEMIDFLVDNKGLNRVEAYSLISVAANFSVTQVVNLEQGVHCSIRKDIFPQNQGSGKTSNVTKIT